MQLHLAKEQIAAVQREHGVLQEDLAGKIEQARSFELECMVKDRELCELRPLEQRVAEL
jgi:hypothetical protein